MNALLATIGESPVDTLLGVLPTDAGTALANIRRFSRQLQKSGWSFNSEGSFPLAPDVNGEIVLPANTLKVDPTDPAVPYVQRDGRLYDPVQHTYRTGKPSSACPSRVRAKVASGGSPKRKRRSSLRSEPGCGEHMERDLFIF